MGGLYSALFSGVSGLTAQGSQISIISNNVANINTIGYKAYQATFASFVTNTSGTNTFSSGGVSSSSKQKIDQQGVVQNTGVATDVAVSGGGFIPVNTKGDGTGEFLYTRKGDFQLDKLSNFVNSSGYVLMGWPLDNSGNLPGTGRNSNTTPSSTLESLKPVNIRTVSGTASGTDTVNMAMNLNQGQTVLQGPGETALFPFSAAGNYQIGLEDVIIPENTSSTSLGVGDSITLTPTMLGTNYTFTYGGVSESNDITTGILGAFTTTQPFTGATSGWSFTLTNNTSGTVTFTYTPNNPNTLTGQFNSLSTLASAINAVDGISARVYGNRLFIAAIDGTQAMTFTDVTPASFVSALGLNNVAAQNNRFSTLYGLNQLITHSPGLNAIVSSPQQATDIKFFNVNPLDTLGVSATKSRLMSSNPFTTAPAGAILVNGIKTGAIGSAVLTITQANHGYSTGEYVTFGTGSVVDGVTLTAGQQYQITVTGTNTYTLTATAGTATAGNTTGGVASTVHPGTFVLSYPSQGYAVGSYIDVQGLSSSPMTIDNLTLSNGIYQVLGVGTNTIRIAATNAAVATSTLGSVSNGGSSVTISDAVGANAFTTGTAGTNLVTVTQNNHGYATGDIVSFGTASTVDGVTIQANTKYTITVTGANTYTINASGTATVGATTGGSASIVNPSSRFLREFGLDPTKAAFGPAYDPTGTNAPNMAMRTSIQPHYTRNIQVFDHFGAGHNITVAFLKIAENQWAVEIYAADQGDLVSSRTDGQIVSGTLVFNGDGTIRSVSPALGVPLTMTWANLSLPSQITFNFGIPQLNPDGTVNTSVPSTGFSQLDSSYDTSLIDQNGFAPGLLNAVTVDADGYVIAGFSNGASRRIYKLPLVQFANPNGMADRGSDVFSETINSGNFNLKEAGQGGVGRYVAGALEQANVELSEQLTNMIIAQKGYQANTKTIKTSNELLDALNSIIV